MKKLFTGIVLSISVFIISANAETDYLQLRGKVLSIHNNIVKINVKTLSCPGVKKFRIGENVDTSRLKKGKTVNFFINSSTCKTKDIPVIIKIGKSLNKGM
ncbi:hypothetical protein [Persephonella sp.]